MSGSHEILDCRERTPKCQSATLNDGYPHVIIKQTRLALGLRMSYRQALFLQEVALPAELQSLVHGGTDFQRAVGLTLSRSHLRRGESLLSTTALQFARLSVLLVRFE